MKKQSGFTLIELMVVIAIIAVLTAIGVNGYSSSMRKGRDARRKSDIQAISQALTLYRMDWSYYPDPTTEYFAAAGADPASCGAPTGGRCHTFGNYIQKSALYDPASKNYNATFPGSTTSFPYTYLCYKSGGRCKSYFICAALESKDSGGNFSFYVPTWPEENRGQGGEIANFGASSMETFGEITGQSGAGVQWYCARSG